MTERTTTPIASQLRGDIAQLRDLQAVTDAALAHLELNELLPELLRRVREILHTDTAAILLLDEEANELVATAAVGLEEEVERGVRIPLGRGFAGRVAAEQRPILLPDVDHADVLNPILREKGIKTMLGVPLVAGGKVLGVLHVGTLVPRTFEPEDLELLQFVSDRAALAIDHARLFAAEREARIRWEQVQSVVDVVLTHHELDDLLPALLRRVREILHTDTAAILLLDEEANELVATAAVGLEEEVERGVRIPLGRGFAGRVAAERRPILLPDVDQADVFNPLLREKGIKTLLGVPLLARGDVLGVLHVGTLQHRELARADVELLQLVAERAALAIERARVQDDRRRLDESKLNFVAIASHELRTPATSIYGVVETLRTRKASLPPETREKLEAALWEQAERLRQLTDQILDLSRLDARSIEIRPEPVELEPFLRELVARVEPERVSEVRIDVDEHLGATVDPGALERVLSNLIANGLAYGEPPVVITASRDDQELQIAVEDAGPGIVPERAAHIFDRFERGHDSTGSGLGLAIARTYARAHSGDLVYRPGPVGRFELVLPLPPAD